MIPARRVHGRAGEGVEARDLGRFGLAEHACRADHVSRGDLLAVRGLDVPRVGVLVEPRPDHLGVQPDAIAHPVLVHAVLRVGLELRPRRVHARPVAALLEGELVAEGRDVDRDPRVGVPVPGAPDTVPRLEHDEVAEAGLVELDRRPDAREAGTDHDDLVVHCDIRSIHMLKVSRTLAERRGGAGHERPPGRAAVVSAHAHLPTTIEGRRDLIACIYVGSVDHEVFMFFGRHRSDKRETKRAAADLTKLLRRCARIRVGGGISAQAHAACAAVSCAAVAAVVVGTTEGPRSPELATQVAVIRGLRARILGWTLRSACVLAVWRRSG